MGEYHRGNLSHYFLINKKLMCDKEISVSSQVEHNWWSSRKTVVLFRRLAAKQIIEKKTSDNAPPDDVFACVW